MLPKFNTSAASQFQTLDESGSRELSPSGFADDSRSNTSGEHRDDSSCDIFSAEGKQFSVSSAEAEAREAFGKEMVQPGSPVDCFGFPETGTLTNGWPNAKSTGGLPKRKDTAPETVSITSASEEFRNRQWLSLPPPPPPPGPPPTKTMNISASVAAPKKDTGARNMKDAILDLAEHVAMSEGFHTTEWPDTSRPRQAPPKNSSPTSTPPPTIGKSLAKMFEQQTMSETEIMTSFEKTFSPSGTLSESSFHKDDTSFFTDSVGTMDAFGFPLVEPITPAKSIGTKSTPNTIDNKSMPITPAKSTVTTSKNSPKTPATNKSMRAVPGCARDSPVKAVSRIKSVPALNRLIANAQMQAHYKEDTAFQFQADFSIPDAQTSASGSTALSEANEEPKQKVDELKTEAALPSARELGATDSKVDKLKTEAALPSTRDLVANDSKVDERKPKAASKPIRDLGPVKIKIDTIKPKAAHTPIGDLVPVKIKINTSKPKAAPTSIRDLVATDSKIVKVKTPYTDNADKLIVGSLDYSNKSCEYKDAILAVTSTELTDPMNMSAFSRTFPRNETPSMKLDGSFDANESSIALLDSSLEIPMKLPQRRKRLPGSKLRCTDDHLYCNINLKEVEKTMWEFMDAFDERAGKCGYVVGCTDRVPQVVSTNMNDTFSLLEDEFLMNKASEHSVSLLDSLTIDDF